MCLYSDLKQVVIYKIYWLASVKDNNLTLLTLSCLQQLVNMHYPEPDESSPQISLRQIITFLCTLGFQVVSSL
jgi:hypothetical protein